MEVLAGTEEDKQCGPENEEGGDVEGITEAEMDCHEAAHEESGHVTGEERTVENAKGVALLFLRSRAGDEGHGGRDGTRQDSLKCPKQDELHDVLRQAH